MDVNYEAHDVALAAAATKANGHEQKMVLNLVIIIKWKSMMVTNIPINLNHFC
jgi:hypothetical protein